MKRLAFAAAFIVAGLVLGLNWHPQTGGYGQLWPLNTFLYNPEYRLGDLKVPVLETIHMDPYHYYMKNAGTPSYFPFAFLALSTMRHWPTANVVALFVGLSIVVYLLACLLSARIWKNMGIESDALPLLLAVIAFANYPFLLALTQGNIEAILAGLCFISLLLLYLGRPYAAALILAVPIALKGYPMMLGLVFVAEGRWRAALLAGLAA
ncbi:MAG TPA: glycosyltransferase family 87 protein, partial [bacterium]|nr:glycosyltransferase family 87 protein [bacterium]